MVGIKCLPGILDNSHHRSARTLNDINYYTEKKGKKQYQIQDSLLAVTMTEP